MIENRDAHPILFPQVGRHGAKAVAVAVAVG
jgi:hypothetical protein